MARIITKKESIESNNRLYVAKVDVNSCFVNELLNELSNGKILKNTKQPVDVLTFHNAVRNHAKLEVATYLWDQVDHVKITDWSGEIDVTSDQVEGNVIYQTTTSHRINKIQENPYILSYMVYGEDDSSRSGDGRWGTVNLCSTTKALNGLEVPIDKYSNEVAFLQFELEAV